MADGIVSPGDLRRQRTILGRLLRDIGRKQEALPETERERLCLWWARAESRRLARLVHHIALHYSIARYGDPQTRATRAAQKTLHNAVRRLNRRRGIE